MVLMVASYLSIDYYLYTTLLTSRNHIVVIYSLLKLTLVNDDHQAKFDH